jgi:hypothetical protein
MTCGTPCDVSRSLTSTATRVCPRCAPDVPPRQDTDLSSTGAPGRCQGRLVGGAEPDSDRTLGDALAVPPRGTPSHRCDDRRRWARSGVVDEYQKAPVGAGRDHGGTGADGEPAGSHQRSTCHESLPAETRALTGGLTKITPHPSITTGIARPRLVVPRMMPEPRAPHDLRTAVGVSHGGRRPHDPLAGTDRRPTHTVQLGDLHRRVRHAAAHDKGRARWSYSAGRPRGHGRTPRGPRRRVVRRWRAGRGPGRVG